MPPTWPADPGSVTVPVTGYNRPMRLIDTHQHLWDLDLFTYSWMKGQPVLDRNFSLVDYRKATEGIDVVQSVFVEADVDQHLMIDEAKHILELADRDDNPISGLVAAARPETDDFIRHIEAIAGHPALKGIRRLLQSERDDLAIDPVFLKNIASLERFGLSFDICVRAHQFRRSRWCGNAPVFSSFSIIAVIRRSPRVSQTAGVRAWLKWLHCPMSAARSRGSSSTVTGITGPAKICDRRSSGRSLALAGIESCSAVTGRSARWRHHSGAGSRRSRESLRRRARRIVANSISIMLGESTDSRAEDG